MTTINPTPEDGVGGWTPLRYAIILGDPKLVRKLLQAGADTKVKFEKAYPEFATQKGDTMVGHTEP